MGFLRNRKKVAPDVESAAGSSDTAQDKNRKSYLLDGV